MNPLLSEAIASVLRSVLKIGAGYLVARGVWSQADANTYIAAAALALVGFGWSYWSTYKSHIKFLTALQSPAGTAPATVDAKIASGMGAKITVMLLAVGLTAAMSMSACVKPAPNVTPNATVTKLLKAVQITGTTVQTIQAEEITLFQGGVISATDHAQIEKGFAAVSASVTTAIDTLQATSTATTQQQVVTAIETGIQSLAQTIGHLSNKQAQELAAWLQTAAAVVDVSLVGAS